MCEASGAVALPEGSFGDRFLMLNNEDNILRIYAVGTPEAPVEKNIGDAIGLSSRNRDDIDLEAATWLDGQAILVGSLGRNNDGEVREARWQFLSVAVEGDVVTTPKGRSDKLLAALAALDPDFAAAIGDLTKDDADLSPKKAGINLEGMSVAADGASLFLGFRNPVPRANRSWSSSSTRRPSSSRRRTPPSRRRSGSILTGAASGASNIRRRRAPISSSPGRSTAAPISTSTAGSRAPNPLRSPERGRRSPPSATSRRRG